MDGFFFTCLRLFILCRILGIVALPTRRCSWYEIYDPKLQLCQTVHCEEHCHFDLKTDLIQPVIIEKCRDNCFEKYVGIVSKACGAGRLYDRVGVCENCQKCEFIEYTSLTENECEYFCNYTKPDNSTRTVPQDTSTDEEKSKLIIIYIGLSFGSIVLVGLLVCAVCVIIRRCILKRQNKLPMCCRIGHHYDNSNDVKDNDLNSPIQCSSDTCVAIQDESTSLLPLDSTTKKGDCESFCNTECYNTSSDGLGESHSPWRTIDVHRSDDLASLSDRQENPDLCRTKDTSDSKTHTVRHDVYTDVSTPVNVTLKNKQINTAPIGNQLDILSHPDTDATFPKLLNSSANIITSNRPITEHTNNVCNYQTPKHSKSSTKTSTKDVRTPSEQNPQARYLSWSSDNPHVEIVLELPNACHTDITSAYPADDNEHRNQATVNQQAVKLSEQISYNNVSQSRPCDLPIESDSENIHGVVSDVDTASAEHVSAGWANSVSSSISYAHNEISGNVVVDVFPVQEEGLNDIQDESFGAAQPLEADVISVGYSSGISSGLGSLRLPLQDSGLTREEATVNEISELPQHLSLIPNIEDVFRRITRNNWARNVVSNGRFIRVRFDALNEDLVRQRIREQTGLNDRHFECIYDPSDSPFNSLAFNGPVYH